MPFLDICVGDGREGFGRQVYGKEVPRIWMLDAKVPDSILDEGNMLFGPEQNLDTLPADKARRRERGNRRRIIVVGGGLEGMLTADACVDPAEGCVRDIDKQRCKTTNTLVLVDRCESRPPASHNREREYIYISIYINIRMDGMGWRTIIVASYSLVERG
jgi:hypothetical protein